MRLRISSGNICTVIGQRSCNNTVLLLLTCFSIFCSSASASFATVSMLRIVQPTLTRSRSCMARARLGLVTPYGGRKIAGAVPVTDAIASVHCCISAFICRADCQSKCTLWLKEWLPTRCPSAAMRCNSASLPLIFFPITKKVAGTCSCFRMSSIAAVHSCGPSSKVRATGLIPELNCCMVRGTRFTEVIKKFHCILIQASTVIPRNTNSASAIHQAE
ncbi:hypothetical protein D3C80_1495480 [compost metagenome]